MDFETGIHGKATALEGYQMQLIPYWEVEQEIRHQLMLIAKKFTRWHYSA